MLRKLIGQGIGFVANIAGPVRERVVYEADRARRLVPTLIRFGLSELEDRIHEYRHRRGECDHSDSQEGHGIPARKRRKKSAAELRRHPSNAKRAPTKKNNDHSGFGD